MKESYVTKLIEEGKRIDGRSFEQFRPVKIETGVVTSAEGSARVKLGGSLVVAGVKLDVKEPYPDTPDQGNLIVDAEFIPFASPEFEPGPPGEEAVELARVVDRGIRESKSIDLEKLVIANMAPSQKPGEQTRGGNPLGGTSPSSGGEKKLVWQVHVDIHVLDHDGNLIDAASLAAIAALLDAHLPQFNPETKMIDRSVDAKPGGKLPIREKPVEVTVWKIASKFVIDPTLEEQEAAECRLTVASMEDGRLCAMQKGGTGFFTQADLLKAVDLAVEKGQELRKLL